MEQVGHRGKTALHELNWLRLSGWCLRPGFGAPQDDERLERMWTLHDEGLQQRAKANWPEWWILWRRVAAGLDKARQLSLFADISPWLWPGEKPPQGPRAHGQIEMLQLLASLERLPPDKKEAAGAWFLARADKLGSYWPLGRLGARALFVGEPGDVVGSATAEAWIERLLTLDWKVADDAAFAAASIARLTGDPRRDISPTLRSKVVARLEQIHASPGWLEMVLRPAGLSEGDVGRMFGESLPAGLRLT
jgi:hypothetical protein